MTHAFRTAAVALATLILLSPPASALTLTPGSVWPGTQIPVCWEEKRSEHRQERSLVRKAVRMSWEAESAVRFTGWRTCRTDSEGIRILTETSVPRTEARGRFVDGLRRGMVLPELWGLAALSVNLKAPVHEFGHALGFGHEFARPDNPDPARCGTPGRNGATYVENDTPLTPFDPDSVMVACIQTATVRMSLGVPRLSPGDIFGLVRTYGSNPDNVLDVDEPGDRFGAAILLQDMDRDGRVDLAVGAPGEDGGAGAVYLYRGDKHSGLRPMARLGPEDLPGAGDLQRFGTALSWQEKSGDGFGRLVVHGAEGQRAALYRPEKRTAPTPDGLRDRPRPFADGTAPQYRIARRDIRRYGFPGAEPADRDGMVDAVADLNGDGIPERILGLPAANGMAEGSGAVVTLRGMPTEDGGTRHLPWYWFGQSY